jgi:hypothetical protein
MTLLMTVASMRRWPADSPWAELQEGRWVSILKYARMHLHATAIDIVL